MKIAVLGAGFSGLAVTYHLLKKTQMGAMIDIFDPLPLGKGASGMSSGLLHTFAGKHAKLSWEGHRALDATHSLISAANEGIHTSCVLSKGILRPALSEEQITHFKKCAEENEECEWWTKEQCLEKVSGLVLKHPDAGGLFIKTGLTIDVALYIEGLWQACARLGATYRQAKITSLEQLQRYDTIICALGPHATDFPELSHLKLTPIKGHVLDLKWPEDLPPLPFSLVSNGYLIMDREGKSCHAGATFERDFNTPDPVPGSAIPAIQKKFAEFFPSLALSQVTGCRAGIRASTGGFHLPLVDRISEKLWIITGMGSKGLLYHALMGEILASAVLEEDPSLLPLQVRVG